MKNQPTNLIKKMKADLLFKTVHLPNVEVDSVTSNFVFVTLKKDEFSISIINKLIELGVSVHTLPSGKLYLSFIRDEVNLILLSY